jgi:hypothetical protein
MRVNQSSAEHDFGQNWTSYGGFSESYGYNNMITPKDLWGGPSPERSFSQDVSWTFKRQGQIKYYAMLKETRVAFAKHISGECTVNKKWRIEPQISAFYTSFPWPSRASVGHTVFLEAREIRKTISETIRKHLNDSTIERGRGLHKASYLQATSLVAEALANRGMFDTFEQHSDLGHVEFYRLFQAAQNTLSFRRLSDIIYAVVLLGDVLPDSQHLQLHPMTAMIMGDLTRASRRYWCGSNISKDNGIRLYLRWGIALMTALCRFLPRENSQEQPPDKTKAKDSENNNLKEYRYPDPDLPPPQLEDNIPALSKPQPPKFDAPQPSLKDIWEKLINEKKDKNSKTLETAQDRQEILPTDMTKALNELVDAAHAATSQARDWEDMREDLVTATLDGNPFSPGPLEGTAVDGHSITSEINGKEVGGELFDRLVPLCEDVEKIRALREQAAPVVRALKHNLYPSINEELQMEYPRGVGQLDPRRLPMAEFCDAIYRRYQVNEALDPSSKAVLLIAADASSSLTDPQMQMCKCLVAAWLDSIHYSRIQTLAAFYSSGSIRTDVSGTLIQWLYHPSKTPVYAAGEAVRAVANVPNYGTGAQRDALSLLYMLGEAKTLSRGVACVYLTLISDCAFNRSFDKTGMRPEEEVAQVIDEGRRMLNNKLHVTLVALEGRVGDMVRKSVDAVISVDKTALEQPDKVAETVGTYVASCIQTRRRKMQQNK